MRSVGLEIGEIEEGVVVVVCGGDFGGGEKGGGGEDSGGGGISRVGVEGAGGVLAAVVENAVLEKVVGGGEQPSGLGRLTRFGFGIHFGWMEWPLLYFVI